MTDRKGSHLGGGGSHLPATDAEFPEGNQWFVESGRVSAGNWNLLLGRMPINYNGNPS